MLQELTIIAGEAFGSGAHESTRLAAAAMELLAGEGFSPKKILDVGCGSGILSLIAASYWPEAQIIATDIAEAAPQTVQENAEANGFAGRITALRADGYDHEMIRANAPYDLILCNMTAEPVTKFAPQLEKHLASEGRAIIAGILAWLADPMLATHAVLSIKPDHTLSLNNWRAFVMGRD